MKTTIYILGFILISFSLHSIVSKDDVHQLQRVQKARVNSDSNIVIDRSYK